MSMDLIKKTHKQISKNTIKANTEMSKDKILTPTKPYARKITI